MSTRLIFNVYSAVLELFLFQQLFFKDISCLQVKNNSEPQVFASKAYTGMSTLNMLALNCRIKLCICFNSCRKIFWAKVVSPPQSVLGSYAHVHDLACFHVHSRCGLSKRGPS